MSEVSQREYFERRLDDYAKLVDQRFDGQSQALNLQAEKNEKHFEALNHEQARLLSDRERFLPRETYAADRKDQASMWISIVSLVVAVLTLLALFVQQRPA